MATAAEIAAAHLVAAKKSAEGGSVTEFTVADRTFKYANPSEVIAAHRYWKSVADSQRGQGMAEMVVDMTDL